MYAQGSSSLAKVSGVAAILVLASACATAPGGPRFQGSRAPEDHRIAVEVRNIGWADVTIYSVSGGSRMRLGVVTSNTSARFRLSRAHEWAPDLRLMADPTGSAHTYESEYIAPTQGQVIRWTVHEARSFRSMAVW